MLVDSFPEYEVETISIAHLLRRRPDILLINGLFTFKEYWREILTGLKPFRRSFRGTPYLFSRVKQLVTDHLSPRKEEYVFSFQLQSLFDASLPGLPHYVYTDHTHLANLEYPQFDRRKLHTPAWIKLEKSVYDNARRVFTRSTNILRSLVRDYGCPPEKLKCVYVGVNVKTSDLAKAEKGIEGKNILFVGLDWERKGGPDLVEAFKQVLEVYPDAQLTIVGCQPQIGLPNCRILGRLPVEEVQRHYAEAAIFCLPTHLEPFGVVFVEAMANRLPIVATNIGAIPDFVQEGENGYLVAPGRTNDLARALIDLLADPEKRKRFGERSYALSVERYNWRSVGESIRLSILEDLGCQPDPYPNRLPLNTGAVMSTGASGG